MLRDFSLESKDYRRLFGTRYLVTDDFIRLCETVGLHRCTEYELENYEKSRLMFPAARVIMPDDYAGAFWLHQLQHTPQFEFDDKHIPFYQLDWELRYQIPRQDQQDFRHPIDRSWGIAGLERPSEKEYVAWDNYTVNVQVGDRAVKRSTVSHYFYYWQIYELYDVRKTHMHMYADNCLLPRFGSPNHNNANELPFIFDALSWFYTLYKANYSRFFEGIQPNNDGIIILDQAQQNNLSTILQTIATDTVQLYKLDENALQAGLRKMLELHFWYEEAERFKLSVALKRDILRFTDFMSYATGKSAEEISKIAGPVGGYIGNYLEILFPNRRKVARDEAFQLVKHLLLEYNKHFPNVSLSDAELTNLLNYTEATSIAWFEHQIVELNKAFFEYHSLHDTMTFLHLKALSSFPEALMKALIQNNGDQQTQQDLNNQRNPGMGTLISLVFRNLAPTILTHYQNTMHWEAKDAAQFSANLTYLAGSINSAASEDEYIGRNLALATLLRNFSSHVAVDNPELLEGQYVLCLRSILVAISSIWKAAQGQHWV